MKSFGILFAALSIVFASVPQSLADNLGDPSATLRQEVSNLRRAVAELLVRIESLEQRLDEAANEQNNARMGNGSLRHLPGAWTDLIAGDVIAMSFDTFVDGTLAVAIYDGSQRLNLLTMTNGQWKNVASQKVPTSKPPRIRMADLNGDGSSDVLVCSDRLKAYTVAPNGWSLVWSGQESYCDAPPPRIGVADFNGDGRKDIAVLNYKIKDESTTVSVHDYKVANEHTTNETRSLYVYTRTPDEPWGYTLSHVATFTDKDGYHSTAAMAIADFSGDGMPEIAVGNDNGYLWLMAFEKGELTLRHQWHVPSGGAVGPGLSAGELDGDTAAELLVGTNGGEIFVIDFDSWHQPRVVAKKMTGRLAYGVASGDIDGDGRDEFVLSRGHLGYAGMTHKDVVAEVWKLKDNELSREWHQETVDQGRPLTVDLNGDGREEIVLLSFHGGDFQVLEPQW